MRASSSTSFGTCGLGPAWRLVLNVLPDQCGFALPHGCIALPLQDEDGEGGNGGHGGSSGNHGGSHGGNGSGKKYPP
jgi:hypothetical protein